MLRFAMPVRCPRCMDGRDIVTGGGMSWISQRARCDLGAGFALDCWHQA